MGAQCSSRLRALVIIGLAWLLGSGSHPVGQAVAEPKGQMILAVDFSIAPSWFDPGEAPAIGTPFIFLYALHDALIKPLPGNTIAPALAESWSESADGLTYEFKHREGLTFHNGDPFTAEDVKFSFERYNGVSAALFRQKVKAVEVVGPHHVRVHLTQPWPDFLAFTARLRREQCGSCPNGMWSKRGMRASRSIPSALAPISSWDFRQA
jgi:peptide/nickel transport system substrate-binding protein